LEIGLELGLAAVPWGAGKMWMQQQQAAGQNIKKVKGVKTPRRWRFLDAGEFNATGEPIKQFEIKWNKARYSK
jgi:hypothetical protein